MKTYFEEVRRKLLVEAQSSPNLLSDLAGLENYISESYHNRSFIELLQNADDAKATKFKIIKNNELLFVANNGRIFNKQDLESLCRSASSNKVRGETIGYRGIGFKSVVGFSKEIHVLSGDLELTFSKNRTEFEIPEAIRVPLIRIPHILNNSDKELVNPIHKILKAEGYNTVFIFTGVTANVIESEFDSFEYNSLIFLRNVVETEISLKDLVSTKITKNQISDSELKMTFRSNETTTNWLISHENQSSIAFSIKDEHVVKLSPDESLVHAFLPTEDCNGLGVLINGNFSTDPSRRHLIFDTETMDSTKSCSNHIIRLLENNIKSNSKENVSLVNALIPFSDPRMIQFMKSSFSKTLLEKIKQKGSPFFKELKLCPTWLNPKDFFLLVNSVNSNTVNIHFYEIDGFNSFAKYLGASEIDFHELKSNINDAEISILGCAQLIQYVFKSVLSHNEINESDFLDLKILHSQGRRKSLKDLNSNSFQVDESFISLLLENGLTEFDIKQVLKRFSPNTDTESQFKTFTTESQTQKLFQETNPVIDWFNKSKETTKETIKASIRRWRNAEEQTLEILNLNGFTLEDVSKQNIGYDLGGLDPNGNEIQIEVKSITLPGQKFKLTNNEIAVAQEKQKSFYIAVVRQNEEIFEIALISDPVSNLTLNRQCVQWIWECEDYEYKPMKFDI